MGRRASKKSTTPVTALRIDGNSVQAAAVSWREDNVAVIHAVRTIEHDALLERVARVSHPIFMDVDFLEFPDTAALRARLKEIVADPLFANPVVGLFPSDCVHDWHRLGPDQPDRRHQRLVRGLRTFQTPNPYDYPKIFGFDETPAEPGIVELDLWSARFDDIIVDAEQYLGASSPECPFLGLVTGKRALREIISLLSRGPLAKEAVTLIDVGKLRTQYAGHFREWTAFTHAIPVGLARDDQHYFQALPIVTNEFDRDAPIGAPVASMFFPPEMTPSPLFNLEGASPQIECTRFGTQVARYAARVLSNVWSLAGVTETPRVFLSGMPTRLVGLRECIEQRIQAKVELVADQPPFEALVLDRDVSQQDVANHLLVIGAAVAYHRRAITRFGTVLRDRRPLHIPPHLLERSPLTPHEAYVIEGPSQHYDASRLPRTAESGIKRPFFNTPTPIPDT